MTQFVGNQALQLVGVCPTPVRDESNARLATGVRAR